MGRYKSAVEYLESFINYENVKKFSYGKSLKLGRVKNIFDSLSIETGKLSTVHVAGTKGKGSTAVFIASILAGSGYRVGLYTSPHLNDFRERIKIVRSLNRKIKSSVISKLSIIKLVNEVKSGLERVRNDPELGRATFFEIYTAIAIKYFITAKVDFAVLECGLGGRLDATNLVLPRISVITHIGYDHIQQLGRRLSQIAFEKAGIIKKEVPVVSAKQQAKAAKVIRDKARALSCPVYFYGKDFFPGRVRINRGYSSFDLNSGLGSVKNIRIKLLGLNQVENASLAVFTCLLLRRHFVINPGVFSRSLNQSFLSGRFEVAEEDKKIIIFDIAHNVSSFKALKANITQYFPDKEIILVFGCSAGKDYKKMLRILSLGKVIITKSANQRAVEPAEIKKNSGLDNTVVTPDPQKALRSAFGLCGSNSIILVTGSAFLVAQVKSLLKGIKK